MRNTKADEILDIANRSREKDRRNEYLRSLPWAKEAPFYNFIYELCLLLQPENIVEIGVMHGTGAAHFMWGSPDAVYWGIDVNMDRKLTTFELPDKQKGKMNFFLGDSLRFVNEVSVYRQEWFSEEKLDVKIGGKGRSASLAIRKGQPAMPLSIDILFIDGEHTTAQCSAEYHAYSPLMAHNGLILFDDIFMGGMEGLWEQIAEPKVVVPDMHGELGFGVAIR